MDLNLFFPTIIGSVVNPNHNLYYETLLSHCINIKQNIKSGGQGWLSNKTYNTSDGQYDLFSDNKFNDLNEWVKNQVTQYCNQLGIISNCLSNNGSWFNIYYRNDFQETHVHPTSVISAIYILTCSNDGARIFFNSPINGMYHVLKKTEKQEMVDKIICSSNPGTLIIFPSYLPHSVERHESDQIRISLSYNYKQL